MSRVYTKELGRLKNVPQDVPTTLVAAGINTWLVVTNVWATKTGGDSFPDAALGWVIENDEDSSLFLVLLPPLARTNRTFHWEGRYDLGTTRGLQISTSEFGWDVQVTGFSFEPPFP